MLTSFWLEIRNTFSSRPRLSDGVRGESRSIDELFRPDSQVAAPQVHARSLSAGLLFAVTVFASAFLLFLVEPVIAKLLLPWFGGVSSVWTTCLLFFQAALFAGYAYAHLLSVRLSLRAQAAVHGLLLLAACLALPIIPSDSWKPLGDEEPVTRLVLVLSATVGLPFFVLSSTGPLLQRWFSHILRGGSSVYRLYALSNVASLLALLSYPTGFEWLLGTSVIARWWSVSFVVFAVLCGACGWLTARYGQPEQAQDQGPQEQVDNPSASTRILWFALAMVPSVLLLATTNAVCQDVASVPFLWILPLSLYLLSFILCFENERWYSRAYVMPVAALALACEPWVMWQENRIPMWMQISAHFLTFFVCAMFCHGELVRRRPHVAHLTSFYLVIAAAGAAGGIFVGVIAPRIFVDYYELQFGLFASGALILLVLATDRQSIVLGRLRPLISVPIVMALGAYGVVLYQTAGAIRGNTSVVAVGRSFYGVLRVLIVPNPFRGPRVPVLELRNGRTTHGIEFEDPALRSAPNSYFTASSGVGRVLSLSTDKPRRVAVIGLGIGTLAAWARPGDYYRYYEINPKDEAMARQHFHYLERCRGTLDVVHGDARLELDREPPQHFDVLVVDAFTGDAPPVHLLTVEAFGVYLRHLIPEGIIAVHVSNRFFALRPVVDAAAAAQRLSTAFIVDPGTSPGAASSDWVLVARDSRTLDAAKIREASKPPSRRRVLWTDDHASLFAVWSERSALLDKVNREIDVLRTNRPRVRPRPRRGPQREQGTPVSKQQK
jgi:spermidine synthase